MLPSYRCLFVMFCCLIFAYFRCICCSHRNATSLFWATSKQLQNWRLLRYYFSSTFIFVFLTRSLFYSSWIWASTNYNYSFDRSPLRLRSNSRSLCFGASSCRWCHQSTSTNWVHFDPWHFPLTKYLVSSRLAKFRSSKFREIFNFETLVSRYASLSKWKGQARLNLK